MRCANWTVNTVAEAEIPEQLDYLEMTGWQVYTWFQRPKSILWAIVAWKPL